MTNNLDDNNVLKSKEETTAWQLNAMTEALGDLTLTIDDSLSIGRGNDNDVVLGSKAVSRNHALLSVLNGDLYIKDLESSNGTFINDERIEGNKSTHINANDTVGFASFVFKVATPHVEANPVTSIAAAPVESATEQSIAADNKDSIPTESKVDEAAEPVVKETIVTEVLSSTVSETEDMPANNVTEPTTQPISAPSTAAAKETVMSDDKSKETLNREPTVNEPVAKQPTAQQPTAHQEPDVAPEHDKTTKTTLQEEADPDVLRAKQAASAQFSGTANLGQGRDLGTEGNNAMDQAVNNPANTGHPEKKPSGGWFIWVFIVIIIIGIALWLFNMGGV